MSSQARELPRRRLTERQAELVDRLSGAAIVELRGKGYDGLTVRNVAARAGVAPATAYTYFASKDHLVAEVFWQRLRALPEPQPDPRRDAAARVREALRALTDLLAAEPSLAAASTIALLATDPDVKHLRDRIGAEIRRRLETALGGDDGEAVLRALDFSVAGAMIQAGMGHLTYDELPDRIGGVVELLLGPR
jgi:TetR/AcrR family transcriptional regulator, cholesterol catabolism regulator